MWARARSTGILVAGVLLASGCQQSLPDQPYQRFEVLLARRDYQSAFRMVDHPGLRLEQLPAAADGLEYSHLLQQTARTGTHDWRDIFRDPRIPLHHKLDLVEEIHEQNGGDPARPAYGGW